MNNLKYTILFLTALLFLNYSFSQELKGCNIDLRKVSSLGEDTDAFKLLNKSKRIEQREMFFICDGDTLQSNLLSDTFSILSFSQIDLIFKFENNVFIVNDVKQYICNDNIQIVFFYNKNISDNNRIMITTNSFKNSSCSDVYRTYVEDLKNDYHLILFNNRHGYY